MLINDVHIGDEVTFSDWALEVRPRRLRVADIVRQTRPGESRAVRQVQVVELDYSTGDEIPEGAMVDVPGAYHVENRSETGRVYLASALTLFAPQAREYEAWALLDQSARSAAEALDEALTGDDVDARRLSHQITSAGVPIITLVLTPEEAIKLAHRVEFGRKARTGEWGPAGG
jgi:hypothetical protein